MINRDQNNLNNNTKKILAYFNIKKKNCELLQLNLGKIIIFIKKKNKRIVFKIPTDKYTTKLIQNENKGYINKDIKLKFTNTPKFTLIKLNKNLCLGKMNDLGNINGNYLDFRKFYKELNYFRLKKTNIKKYLNLLKKKNFFTINLFKKDFDKYYYTIIKKFKNRELLLSASHGDFIYWNTAIKNKKYYVYDLEFFSKKRIYLYDKIHWYFLPIFQKLYKFNFFYKLLNKNIIFFFILFFLKNIFFMDLKKKDFNIYLILYLIEKENYYKNLLLHLKIHKNSEKTFEDLTKFIKILHTKLLNYLLK